MVLRPGTAISETHLAAEHGVSRTPVREALLRLAKERLVEIVPKSGTFVGRIPVSALIEALVARRALESVVARRAAEVATQSAVLELRALVERQREIVTPEDLPRFHQVDEDFHAMLAKMAGYNGIWELVRQIKLQVDRYRHLTLPQEGRVGMVIKEHAAVVDAIERGDTVAAAEAMETHLDKLQLDIKVFRELWPDYFVHDYPLDG
ncbi:transcriptional regulator NanR [Tritonibacter horizontis]|uniref:Transcriptional regulator NanR n=2 Tax=Tritonibacter horizontis TaxID=1768241 RepID=A0A132BTX2_9RHOB|nr:transcriptional regulator NanR [Tritonibacter horizontis]